MRTLFKDNIIEALVGLLVLLLAGGFVSFAWGQTRGAVADGYEVKARFSSAAGISPGTAVKVAGIKVGQVTSTALDPASYQALLALSLDKGLKLPIDSSAAITSEGLLGGAYIALTPGADAVMLKPGEEITDTSGAADLMSLIGSVVNRSGSGQGSAPGK